MNTITVTLTDDEARYLVRGLDFARGVEGAARLLSPVQRDDLMHRLGGRDDDESSVSCQHFIDTGHWLRVDNVTTDDDGISFGECPRCDAEAGAPAGVTTIEISEGFGDVDDPEADHDELNGSTLYEPRTDVTLCLHCGRPIVPVGGSWVDPEAKGDDSMWGTSCDAHDTFAADHEPARVTAT